jgi:SAM-dependent MidA family methyltransferase
MTQIDLSLHDISVKDLERSEVVYKSILRAVNESSGRVISFDTFMHLVLYNEYGYYTGGNQIFGPTGDFVTAPESGELFGRCLAAQCFEILQSISGNIIEYGAGTGRLAVTILREYQSKQGELDFNYIIVEPSRSLRARQKKLIAEQIPELLERIIWFKEHPRGEGKGVVIANEVFDAMPSKRFVATKDGIKEVGVGLQSDQLTWEIMDCAVPAGIRSVLAKHPLGYCADLIQGIESWFRSFKNCFKEGVLIVSDYGYGADEFFHHQRIDGTLQCHFRHQVHDNPFQLFGLQDLTSSVNFTELAECAHRAGMSVEGYTSQAHFLIGNKIHEMISGTDSEGLIESYQLAQEAKRLLLPTHMGENFRFMGLFCNIEPPMKLSGFAHDERYRLG